MDLKLQEEDVMWHKILACMAPIVSMCLHAPLPLQFSLVFIYLAPLLNIYVTLMFKHHSLWALTPNPKASTPNLGN